MGLMVVACGTGMLVSGEPMTGPHEAQGCGRLLLAVLTSGGAAVLGSFAISGPGAGEAISLGFAAVFFGAIVSGGLWVAEHIAAVLVRPLALRLEPNIDLDELGPAAAIMRQLMNAEADLWRAAHVPDARRSALAAGVLEGIDRFPEEALAALRPSRRKWLALCRAEALLAFDRLDEAEREAPSTPCEPAVRAEVARRRGDPERAVRLAEEWLATADGQGTMAGPSTRASALALLALARCDQGRFEDAEAHLAASRSFASSHARAMHHLTPEVVQAYIGSCRGRPRTT